MSAKTTTAITPEQKKAAAAEKVADAKNAEVTPPAAPVVEETPAEAPAEKTPEQKKAEKAAKDKARREEIKAAKVALAKAKLPEDTKLDTEQRGRAARSSTEKAGLSGKSLAKWILEGKGAKQQIAEGQLAEAGEKAAERTRQNATRSSDPEAATLAAAAKGLAEDVKSAFLPKDARAFLDTFAVFKKGAKITVRRASAEGVEGALAEVVFDRTALEAFSIGANKDAETRKSLSGLGKDTRLWGRKLGLMILAKAA